MAAPLLRKMSVLAASIEATPGAAESLDATDGVFNVFNAEIQPDIEYDPREGQGDSISPIVGAMGARAGTATFEFDLQGGATAPDWAATFLPACGLGNTNGTFALDRRPPEAAGSKSKTITIGMYRAGLYKQLHGAMGNAVFIFRPGQVGRIRFTFRGIWTTPSNVALIAPNYPAPGSTLRVASGAVTIGSFAPKFSELTIDMGNEIVLRPDPATLSGYHSAVITGRRISGQLDHESTLSGSHTSSVWDVWADMLARTTRALSIALGSTGNQFTLTAPALQITNVQEGERNGIQIENTSFELVRSLDAGEDEMQIVIA